MSSNLENLEDIRRIDQFASQLYTHAALFNFSTEQNKWLKTEVNGPLLINEHFDNPNYSIIRHWPNKNFVEPITDGLQLRYEPPYVFVHLEDGRIHGLWVFGEDECKRVFDTLSNLSTALKMRSAAATNMGSSSNIDGSAIGTISNNTTTTTVGMDTATVAAVATMDDDDDGSSSSSNISTTTVGSDMETAAVAAVVATAVATAKTSSSNHSNTTNIATGIGYGDCSAVLAKAKMPKLDKPLENIRRIDQFASKVTEPCTHAALFNFSSPKNSISSNRGAIAVFAAATPTISAAKPSPTSVGGMTTTLFQVNCWDANACHNDLEITGDSIRYTNGGGYCSVFAKYPILFNNFKEIFYFEISVGQIRDRMLFGFTDKKGKKIGEKQTICSLSSHGKLRINGKTSHHRLRSFFTGDKVGCGVNLATQKFLFTKNGSVLDCSVSQLSPTKMNFFVSLNKCSDSIEKMENDSNAQQQSVQQLSSDASPQLQPQNDGGDCGQNWAGPTRLLSAQIAAYKMLARNEPVPRALLREVSDRKRDDTLPLPYEYPYELPDGRKLPYDLSKLCC